MRDIPDAMSQAYASKSFEGEKRPMARVTVGRSTVELFKVPDNVFAETPFMQKSGLIREFPSVKSVSWSRSWNSPIAECTIELWNVRTHPDDPDVDLPGFYAYNYGRPSMSQLWGHEESDIWRNLLMPDNIVWTYEGYGFNPAVSPEDDENLVLTGTWLIDEVQMTSQGTIVLTCRDLGRLLQDHILFPPVVPFSAGPKNATYPKGAYSYPVTFASKNDEPTVITHKGETIPYKASRLSVAYDADSNIPWTGGSAVYGHHGRHAFDGDSGSYWLSIGNARGDQGYSFEWVQCKFKKQTVSEVRFRTKYKGYRAFVSVYANGQWVNKGMIAYDPNHPASAPNGSNIPYVKSQPVGSEAWQTVSFGAVPNATKVRLTLSNLPDTNIGTYQHRAAVRELQVFGGAPQRRAPDTVEKIRHYNKNYSDYTDIVKLLLAWGGFYWDRNSARSYAGRPAVEDRRIGGTGEEWQYQTPDKFLRWGRVWGDLEQTGVAGPAAMGVDIFDKKPILEAIEYIRSIVGFVFYVDEYGGAVWRLPNWFSLGNTWRGADSPRNGVRTTNMVHLHDTVHIEELAVRLSSRNMRERTFIASNTGHVGAMAAGWNPNPTGLRRIGGWTDLVFETNAEAQVQADMIALRQLFDYRTDSVTIPAFPRIQVDDQVKLYDRMTTENYVHYVKGIESSNDLESGQWTYTLDTHWLGERPFTKWVFDPDKLARETQLFLRNLFAQ